MKDEDVTRKIKDNYRILADTVAERDEVFDYMDALGFDTVGIRNYWRYNHDRRDNFYVGLNYDDTRITTFAIPSDGQKTILFSELSFGEDNLPQMSDADFQAALDELFS